ncbi:MAG: HDOD domain-containing protein [candidate division Zixibacteria bacterium]|nr:HDOD domain-containing protein [candidate division Zixibacteria bacterium]
MDKQTILSQIEQRDDLLSLPQALAEILREVDNPNFGSDQLARIILKDPPLTAKILKMANSSTYQRFGRVSNVNQAVQTLGVMTVKCLALSSSILNPDKIEKESGINPRRYFESILTVAAACEKIAEAIGQKSTEDAFIAGLLHDVGTMFFMCHYPADYRNIAAGKIPGVTNILDAEIKVFGINHCEVGYLLAGKWRLPNSVVRATREHHNDVKNDKSDPIAGIVQLATLMVDQSVEGQVIDLETRLPAITSAGEALGLDREQLNAVSVGLLPATVAIANYLEIDIGSIEDILARANGEIWRAYFMIENLFRERQELSRKLLEQERSRGAFESKTIAMATLSHYMNNTAMAIYGRSQMIRMRLDKQKHDELIKMLPVSLDVIDQAIRKTVAVLAEMKEISPIDKVEFFSTSKALDMDDRIERRMEQMAEESGVELPEEVGSIS